MQNKNTQANVKQTRPGVTRIGWIYARVLSGAAAMQALSSSLTAVYSPVNWIRFYGEPDFEVSSKYDNRGRSYEASLSFESADDIPVHTPVAFVVQTADGTKRLIGGGVSPYPMVSVTDKAGAPSGDSAVRVYDVSFVSALPIPMCIC